MGYELTPAVLRALALARPGEASEAAGDELARLLAGLLLQTECRAARLLAAAGIDQAVLGRDWQLALAEETKSQSVTTTPPDQGYVDFGSLGLDCQAAIRRAVELFVDHPQPLALGTEHLLVGLASLDHPVAHWLAGQGFDARSAETLVHRWHGLVPGPLADEGAPLPAESAAEAANPPAARGERRGGQPPDGDAFDEPWGQPLDFREPPTPAPTEPPRPTEQPAPIAAPGRSLSAEAREGTEPPPETGLFRALDAEANRAEEGLRVVEDHARFVLDDRQLTSELKTLRHELAACLEALAPELRLRARDTLADVGTDLTTAAEQRRGTAGDVAAANWKRTQQALRSLEEFSKVLDPAVAARVEALRYRSYTLERSHELTRNGLERLAEARLYVLIDGRGSAGEMLALAQALLDGGADLVQLRDKRLTDRELLDRARALRRLTAGTRLRLVINDRPDLARLVEADGVHVGQDELSVKDVRQIVGPRMLVGVSTHRLEEARQAVLDGADYLGVGPVFASGTKSFSGWPGPELLEAVGREIRLPAFAIGGIDERNLDRVLATGFSRIAVSGAVQNAADPAAACRALRARLVAAARTSDRD